MMRREERREGEGRREGEREREGGTYPAGVPSCSPPPALRESFSACDDVILNDEVDLEGGKER